MMMQNMRFFWIATSLGFLSSVGSAVLAERFLDHRIALVGSFVGIQKSLNAGVAFGMELGVIEPFLVIAALCIVAGVALRTSRTRLSHVGYGLVVGGGAANILDRFRDGYVTDFFQIGSFPVFNVADACVTVGIGLLFVEMLFSRR